MKKITLATLAILAAFGSVNVAHAAETNICDSTSDTKAKDGTAPAAGAAENFMSTAIQPKCSANVNLQGRDGANGSFYAVGANSAKGKSNFVGHTNGGAVVPSATACATPGGCTLAEAQTAAGEAATAAAAAAPEEEAPADTPPANTE